MQLKYRFKQLTRNGMWTSDSVFEGPYDAVVHEVIAGHVVGQARAAVEEATGRVIYAVDARGACTQASIALFESGSGLSLHGSPPAPVAHEEWSRRRHDVAGRQRVGASWH